MASSRIEGRYVNPSVLGYRTGWGTSVTLPSWRGQQGLIQIGSDYLGMFWNLQPDSFNIKDIYGSKTTYGLSYQFNNDYTKVTISTTQLYAITIFTNTY